MEMKAVGRKCAVAMDKMPEMPKREKPKKDELVGRGASLAEGTILSCGDECEIEAEPGDRCVVRCYEGDEYMDHEGKKVKFVEEYDIQAIISEKGKKKAKAKYAKSMSGDDDEKKPTAKKMKAKVYRMEMDEE